MCLLPSYLDNFTQVRAIIEFDYSLKYSEGVKDKVNNTKRGFLSWDVPLNSS